MTYLSNSWRLSQCCQFHDKKLLKLYNPGTVTKTYALKPDGKQKVQNKAVSNARKLEACLRDYFSKQPVNLRSFRISSELFPCYTLDFTKEWYAEIWEELSAIMVRVGTIAKTNDIRLSTHPAQFTVLASNRKEVVENSIKDLEYHAQFGKLMGLDANDFTINIHLQGLYGGTREAGIKRFATHYTYLSDYASKALAVENEDKHKSGYDIEHVLQLSTKIPIRATYDLHHYECMRQKDCNYPNVNQEYFKNAVNTWKNIRPLFHVSHSKINADRINQHSDILHDEERLASLVPLLQYADFDIEAKFKEQACKHAYRFVKEEEHYAGEPIKCLK